MTNGKLMIMKGYYRDYPVLVNFISKKMITIQHLTGRIEQTKKGYIDYPSLKEARTHRLSSFNNSYCETLRSMTEEELAINELLLKQALINQGVAK